MRPRVIQLAATSLFPVYHRPFQPSRRRACFFVLPYIKGEYSPIWHKAQSTPWGSVVVPPPSFSPRFVGGAAPLPCRGPLPGPFSVPWCLSTGWAALRGLRGAQAGARQSQGRQPQFPQGPSPAWPPWPAVHGLVFLWVVLFGGLCPPLRSPRSRAGGFVLSFRRPPPVRPLPRRRLVAD